MDIDRRQECPKQWCASEAERYPRSVSLEQVCATLWTMCVRLVCGNQDSAGGGNLKLASPSQPGISEMSVWFLGRRTRYWERDPCPPQKDRPCAGLFLPCSASFFACLQTIGSAEVLMGRRELCLVVSSLMVILINLAWF